MASPSTIRPNRRELVQAFAGDGARTFAPRRTAGDRSTTPSADSEWAGVVPLRSAGDARRLARRRRRNERPAQILHEVRLLDAIAGQVSLGIRNIRLAEEVGRARRGGRAHRIAREIHDGIAQMVYMLSLSLETAIDRVGGDPEEQRRRLEDLTALAKNALWEVRQYIFDLRPLLSGDEGLVGAVQGQVKEFQAVSDLPVELASRASRTSCRSTTSAALYRIVQEGLGNIFRHAQASQVSIDLRVHRARQSRWRIEDDGVGIERAGPGRARRVRHGEPAPPRR